MAASPEQEDHESELKDWLGSLKSETRGIGDQDSEAHDLFYRVLNADSATDLGHAGSGRDKLSSVEKARDRVIACIGPAGRRTLMGSAFVVHKGDRVYLVTCAHVLLDIVDLGPDVDPAQHGVDIAFQFPRAESHGSEPRWFDRTARVRYFSIPDPMYFKKAVDWAATEAERLEAEYGRLCLQGSQLQNGPPNAAAAQMEAQAAGVKARQARQVAAKKAAISEAVSSAGIIDLRRVVPSTWLGNADVHVGEQGYDLAIIELECDPAELPPKLDALPFAKAKVLENVMMFGYGQSGIRLRRAWCGVAWTGGRHPFRRSLRRCVTLLSL